MRPTIYRPMLAACGSLRNRSPGLTLIEIIVVLAVLLVLAAAVTPSLIGGFERNRAVTAVEELQELTDAMSEMRKDAGNWPGRLSHLATAITTNDDNVCWGANYGQPRVNTWDGPYLDRTVPATGLPIAIGIIKDSVYRSSINGVFSLLTLQISSVSELDARAVNASVDNDGDVAGRTAGTVQWTVPTTEGLVTMFYYRPIRDC